MLSCIKKVLVTIFIILSLIQLSKNASISKAEQNKYRSFIEGQGLYTMDDDVEIITSHNFKNELYGKNYSWIIEFYSSWCGFCQRFAPSWKAFASEIKHWNHVVKVGAIDCANEDNTQICRNFEIMAYPTLKYFHEYYTEGPKNLGSPLIKGVNEDDHKKYLLEKMITEQHEGRGRQFPYLLPYTKFDTSLIFNGLPADKKYVILIVSTANSNIGAEIALDLYKSRDISVLYSHDTNTILVNNLRINKFPAVFIIDRNNLITNLNNPHNSKEKTLSFIKEYLQMHHIDVPVTENLIIEPRFKNPVQEMATFVQERDRRVLKDKVKKMGDVVFQMDLEAALKFSLQQEIATHKSISGEKLEALRNYLTILYKYFPFGRQGQQFLDNLRRYTYSKNEISGQDIERKVKEAETEGNNVFSSATHWLACEGSSPEKRGYPCGLWKLFHYLTVNAAEFNKGRQNVEPLEILNAMHGYVKNFFGCAECSQHFQEMAAKRDMNSVLSLDSAILWLWMAHNEVNKRLSGDPTEDSEFPKNQFPSKERCPYCRNSDGSWNFNEVLNYLKQMYSAINVRYIGSDTRILHMGIEDPALTSGAQGIFRSIDTTRLQEKDVRTRPVGQSLRAYNLGNFNRGDYRGY